MGLKKTLASLVIAGALAVGGLSGKAKANDILFQDDFTYYNNSGQNYAVIGGGDFWHNWDPQNTGLFGSYISADEYPTNLFHTQNTENWNSYSFELEHIDRGIFGDESLFFFVQEPRYKCYKLRYKEGENVTLSRIGDMFYDGSITGQTGEVLYTMPMENNIGKDKLKVEAIDKGNFTDIKVYFNDSQLFQYKDFSSEKYSYGGIGVRVERFGDGIDNLMVQEIPEPATLGLLGLGSLALLRKKEKIIL